MAAHQPAVSASISSLGERTDSLVSLTSASHISASKLATILKRASSSSYKRHEDFVRPDFGPPTKRRRPLSPPPHDYRDGWEGSPRRRFGSTRNTLPRSPDLPVLAALFSHHPLTYSFSSLYHISSRISYYSGFICIL